MIPSGWPKTWRSLTCSAMGAWYLARAAVTNRTSSRDFIYRWRRPGNGSGNASKSSARPGRRNSSRTRVSSITTMISLYCRTFTAAGHGRPSDDLPHVFWTHVADTTEQALKEAQAGMKRKLGSASKVWVKPGVKGYETFAKIGQFLATATIDQLDALSIFGDP